MIFSGPHGEEDSDAGVFVSSFTLRLVKFLCTKQPDTPLPDPDIWIGQRRDGAVWR